MTSIWCVWTEWGEYEQFSRDLEGLFASEALAKAHAAQLRDSGHYDTVEVFADMVLDQIPVSVPYVRYAAHILPDGSEDGVTGYHRGSEFSTWSNALRPLESSRVSPWSRPDLPDMYIEVIGSDEPLVAAEYERLLVELRTKGRK